MAVETLVIVPPLEIEARSRPSPETRRGVALGTLDVAMYGVQVRHIEHLASEGFCLLGKNGLLAIEKHLLVEEADLPDEVHAHHEAAAAHFLAEVRPGKITFAASALCQDAQPHESSAPACRIRRHGVLMRLIRRGDVGGSHNRLIMLAQRCQQAGGIMRVGKLHVGVGNQGKLITLLCRVAQPDIVACVVAPVLLGADKGAARFSRKFFHGIGIVQLRTVVHEDYFQLHALLALQEGNALAGVGARVVVEHYDRELFHHHSARLSPISRENVP